MLDSDDSIQMAAYIEAAERYFQELPDPQRLFAKPYVPLQDAGYNVARFGYLLHHLDHQPFHTVLDFGAGMCWLTALLLRTGCRVVALDVSETALRLGTEALRQANLPADPQHVKLLSYDGFRIPLEDASVDRVACFDALHHVPNKRTILRELFRVLRNGGRVCVAEPGPGHAASAEARAEAEVWGVLEDEVDAPRLCAMAAEIGFASSYVVPLPVPADNMLSPAEYQRLRDGQRPNAVSWTGNDALIVLTKVCGDWLDSRSPGNLAARITVLQCPEAVAPGALFSIDLEVLNAGDTVWVALRPENGAGESLDYAAAFLSPGSTPGTANTRTSVTLYRQYIRQNELEGTVAVGAQLWPVASDAPIDIDYARGFLDRDLEPGASSSIRVQLRAPADPGAFRLTFDLVAECLSWFGRRGSTVVHRYIKVDGDPSLLDSRSPGQLSADLRIVDETIPSVLSVSVTNQGNTTWLAYPLDAGGWVRLGLQAVSRGAGVDRDWRRVPLPRDVLPGETVTIKIDLRDVPPFIETIRLDLVSELRAWFEDHGSQTLEYSIRR